MSVSQTASSFGFVSISRDIKVVLEGRKFNNPPTIQTVNDIGIPQSPLAAAVNEYAKKELPLPVYNHSVRVYLYGIAILKDQFPQWDLNPEVYYVTCLLHDIGTTEKNMAATKMSFEFYGGLLARELISDLSNGNQDFSEAVSEAIIRHQDLGTVGFITTLGLLIQLGTILDNVGLHADLIHLDTIESINKAYPRHKWLNCFAEAIHNENRLKPWGHTSALGVDDFPNDVLKNQLMKKYE